MHRFYSDQLTNDTDIVVLNDLESNHAVKVLRLNEGQTVEILNGIGIIAQGIILSAHHKKCEVKIIEKQFIPQASKKLHVAISPTKSNDRFEWFLEKAVEIGVDEFTPLISENSERVKLNFERLEKIILSAIKQSLRPHKPVLNQPEKVISFIHRNPNALIAHCDVSFERIDLKNHTLIGDATIMIGPEGDFSRHEIQTALTHNLKSVSLGENRLRTETAGLVSATLLNALRI